MSALRQGGTAQQAPKGLRQTFDHAVFLDRIDGILRTRGIKAAAAEGKQRADVLVRPDGAGQYLFEHS